jgi:hypothetical protein
LTAHLIKPTKGAYGALAGARGFITKRFNQLNKCDLPERVSLVKMLMNIPKRNKTSIGIANTNSNKHCYYKKILNGTLS